ncbi:MAG: hypothetical protein QOI49_2634 [Verrucomicrobiota bacterium]|jgi:hypothetical protein
MRIQTGTISATTWAGEENSRFGIQKHNRPSCPSGEAIDQARGIATRLMCSFSSAGHPAEPSKSVQIGKSEAIRHGLRSCWYCKGSQSDGCLAFRRELNFRNRRRIACNRPIRIVTLPGHFECDGQRDSIYLCTNLETSCFFAQSRLRTGRDAPHVHYYLVMQCNGSTKRRLNFTEICPP